MDGKVGMTMRMKLHAYEKTENQRVSICSTGCPGFNVFNIASSASLQT